MDIDFMVNVKPLGATTVNLIPIGKGRTSFVESCVIIISAMVTK